MVQTDTARAVLTATQVCKAYGPRTVLDGISLRTERGERLALTGPSGSGKTTLLNCLGGIDRADSGDISLEGRSLAGLSGAELARLRRERIGTIFQFFHLLPTLTVHENVELPLQLLRWPVQKRDPAVGSLLARVGLAERADALPTQLSGGEQQRVAIARALVHHPALLLADEPTGNLDSVNGANILSLLRELTDETGTTLVLVTHSEDAAAICHRRLHLRDGRIV
ncbi:MAG TPA: ABC transporter ATP-binding protein [Opitutaceae bacterium]|jgi:ABC-type lipoprotein export system ATPase subunit